MALPAPLDKQNLLLTGGTGFFGRALLRHWLASRQDQVQGPRVTILTRAPEAFLLRYPEFHGQAWLRLHRGDILQPETFPREESFSHLLHAATDSTLGPRLTPLERYNQIVRGTRNMLEYAARNKISRFLLTSSGGVYGPQPANLERIPEDYMGMPDPLQAANTYSVAKRAAEHLCALYQDRYGIETVIARCFAFVGRDLPLDVHFAIGNFIRDALVAGDIVVQGDGTAVRSYMDQRDLAHWLTVLLARGRSGQAYNVGSDTAITIRELAHLVRDTLSPGKPIRTLGQASAQHTRNLYVPAVDKASAELGLRLTHALPESIRETARHA